MAAKKPLVVGSTLPLEQIQSGDTLDAGAFQLPATIGTEGQVLSVPAIGTELEWTDKNALEDQVSLINANAGTIVICQAVYISAAGSVDLAQADSVATANVFGLVADASVLTTDPGLVQYGGILTATTGQWDTVTGDSGGLTAGSNYYLDETTPGSLTTTKPSAVGEVVEPIGLAVSTTQMKLTIGPAILL